MIALLLIASARADGASVRWCATSGAERFESEEFALHVAAAFAGWEAASPCTALVDQQESACDGADAEVIRFVFGAAGRELGGEPSAILNDDGVEVAYDEAVLWATDEEILAGDCTTELSVDRRLALDIGRLLGLATVSSGAGVMVDDDAACVASRWTSDDLFVLSNELGPFRPTLSTVPDPSEGTPPLEVCFQLATGTSDYPIDSAGSVEWDFGDTQTSTELAPCHTYTDAPGIYTVVPTWSWPESCGGWVMDRPQTTVTVCEREAGLVDTDSDGFPACLDCDDSDASVYPGALEIPNDGRDQDCDGTDTTDGTTAEGCDLDGDGYDALFCGGPDCNDADSTVYPSAVEIAGDNLDQDCDGYDEAQIKWTGGGALCGVAGRAPRPALALALLALARRRR